MNDIDQMVLNESADKACDWLKRQFVKPILKKSLGKIEFYGVAQIAAKRANEEKEADAIKWARFAVVIYEELAERNQDDSYLVSANLARINIIRRFGDNVSFSELHCKNIITWFFNTLPGSYKELEKISLKFMNETNVAKIDYSYRMAIRRLCIVKQLLVVLKDADSIENVKLKMKQWLELPIPYVLQGKI